MHMGFPWQVLLAFKVTWAVLDFNASPGVIKDLTDWTSTTWDTLFGTWDFVVDGTTGCFARVGTFIPFASGSTLDLQ